MQFRAEIIQQEHCGDEVKITFGNIQRMAGADRKYNPEKIHINIPFSSAKSYPLGREVIIEIKPK